MIDHEMRERGSMFIPNFDGNRLLTGVVVHHTSKAVLMVAHLDQQALDATCRTGFAHFYSRSRQQLWKKGETSGNTLAVKNILVDCDQDALVLECNPAGPACHTGAISCFYRELRGGSLSDTQR